ncbi:UPF0715 family protein [Priestia megaterium]|uniref:UPF0715 family protein n=1 Tax=Priestia megaterium TaxID=1404 RepID=UPI0009BA2B6A
MYKIYKLSLHNGFYRYPIFIELILKYLSIKLIYFKNIDATIKPIMVKRISIPLTLYFTNTEDIMIQRYVLSILLSSICLSLLYLIIEYGVKDFISPAFPVSMIISTVVYFTLYTVFGLPTSLLIIKKLPRFSIISLLGYLLIFSIVYYIFYTLTYNPVPFIKNFEVYIYIVSTSIVYWFWCNLMVSKPS